MGTNFYARTVPTELEWAKLQEAVTNRQLDRVKRLTESMSCLYHIGKRSYGWQFLFAPHKCMKEYQYGQIQSPWENTLESIKTYLAKPDVIIENEYGDTFTPEQFWNEEIGASLYNDPEKYINGSQYDEQEEGQQPHFYKEEPFDFITTEGLRFARDADFS